MAYARPNKRNNNVRVDDFEERSDAPPNRGEGTSKSFFSSDYDNMFPGSFHSGSEGIRGPSGCTLETLVATLAKLQFVTKGKVGEDGKFELIFCSPEPVVSEVKNAPAQLAEQVQTPQPISEPKRVQLIEHEPRRAHRRRRTNWYK